MAAAAPIVAIAATAISTGVGIYSSIQQGQQQAAAAKAQARMNQQQALAQQQQAEAAQRQADYQKQIAERNAQMAEDQASAERQQGYENAQAERLKTARLIGQQRAQAGASGALVDAGSFEDVAEDTAAAGEFDALNSYNAGIDKAYNSEIQAWNYRSTGTGYGMQGDAYGMQANAYHQQADAYASQASAADSYRSASTLSAIGQGIGGIASMGSTWAKFNNTPSSTSKPGFIERFGDYSAGRVRGF